LRMSSCAKAREVRAKVSATHSMVRTNLIGAPEPVWDAVRDIMQ
jgi:hypothetical protein